MAARPLPKLTPPELAERWRVSHEKVLSLIHSGELRAINISEGTQKPRFLIDEADIADFEDRKSTRPLSDIKPDRKRSQGGNNLACRRGAVASSGFRED